MDNRPIGVFDSGLGGLTAVRRLRQILPDENIIYFGDTGRMPYGGRPREQMRTIARQNITFAESFDVKVILAACGTISSNAPDIIAANATKTIGVLLPGAERLAATGRKELGVIATKDEHRKRCVPAQYQPVCARCEDNGSRLPGLRSHDRKRTLSAG